jgi:hypothetical protein
MASCRFRPVAFTSLGAMWQAGVQVSSCRATSMVLCVLCTRHKRVLTRTCNSSYQVAIRQVNRTWQPAVPRTRGSILLIRRAEACSPGVHHLCACNHSALCNLYLNRIRSLSTHDRKRQQHCCPPSASSGQSECCCNVSLITAGVAAAGQTPQQPRWAPCSTHSTAGRRHFGLCQLNRHLPCMRWRLLHNSL